jgi:hypothetical protein
MRIKLPGKLLLISTLSVLILTVLAITVVPAMAATSTSTTTSTTTTTITPATSTQAKPTVTSVSPGTGNQGQTYGGISITGTGFNGATGVSFGRGIDVTNFVVNNDTSITANITIANRAFVGSRFVTVTTPAGRGTMAGGFTVSKNAPKVTGVSQTTGNQGQTITGIILTGTNFADATAVSFGRGINVTSFKINSDTSITADITIANRAFVGSRFVTVVDPSGHGTLSAGFTVAKNAPTVTGVGQTTGEQGQTITGITITGTNFADATAVSFGRGIDVTKFTINGDTSITANIVIANQAFVGSRFVTVVDPSGHGTLAAGFTVTKSETNATPAITTTTTASS